MKWIPKKKVSVGTILKTHERNVAKVIPDGGASSAAGRIFDLK